jgi:hypothetical protein
MAPGKKQTTNQAIPKIQRAKKSRPILDNIPVIFQFSHQFLFQCGGAWPYIVDEMAKAKREKE